jgi:Skp family chaperone for outer membrane proteins
MKRFTLAVLLLLPGGLAAQAQNPTPPAAGAAAQAAAPVPGTKFAVIDFEAAIFDSDPGKAAVKNIEDGLKDVKDKFEKLQKEVNDLQTKLQNAKTDAEKSPINRDIEAKATEAKRLQEDGQRTSEELQSKHLPPVAELIRKMVDEYAKENSLAIVIDPTTEGGNIVFAAKTSDITTEVVRRANAEYAKNPKITAPGTAAPAAPPKAN